MSWVIIASPRLSLFEPLRGDKYLAVVLTVEELHDNGFNAPNNYLWELHSDGDVNHPKYSRKPHYNHELREVYLDPSVANKIMLEARPGCGDDVKFAAFRELESEALSWGETRRVPR